MKLQLAFGLLLLLAMVAFAGCYTQIGYPEHRLHTHVGSRSSDFDQRYHGSLEKEKTEDVSEAEGSELEHTDSEESEGYYGRRKYTRRTTYAYPYRHDTHWGAYVPYPYGYYLPVMPYYSHPWYGYGYYGYAPYYRYYRGYYPYNGYYGRYHRSGGRYTPSSRRTYKRGNLRLENRRSRSSRSVNSPTKSRSERPLRRSRDRDEK